MRYIEFNGNDYPFDPSMITDFDYLNRDQSKMCFDPISLALVGSTLATSTAGASVVGLLGAGGVLGAGTGIGATIGAGLASLGSIAGIAGLAATGLGGIAGMQESRARANAAKTNARIAEQNAETSRQQTAAAMDTQDRERRLRLGSSMARGGASGVGVESFGDIMQSSAAQEELDLLTLKTEGQLKENDFLNQASIKKAESKNIKKQGKLKTASSILSGGSTFLKG